MRRRMHRIGLLFTLAVLLGTVHCGSSVGELRARAAFDLECPADSLHLKELVGAQATQMGSGAVYGVWGCNRRVTYVRVYPGTWVMNNEGDRVVSSPK